MATGPRLSSAHKESHGCWSEPARVILGFRDRLAGRRPELPSRSNFFFPRNEPRNPGLNNSIEPDSHLDSFANFLHGLFRKGGDFKVLLYPLGVSSRSSGVLSCAGYPRQAKPAPGSC